MFQKLNLVNLSWGLSHGVKLLKVCIHDFIIKKGFMMVPMKVNKICMWPLRNYHMDNYLLVILLIEAKMYYRNAFYEHLMHQV